MPKYVFDVNVTDQKQSKQTMAWIPGQSQTSKASPGRMQTPFQLFYMYSSRPASAWRSADGRASCAVSVWKSEDGKRWNDLYSAYSASRSSKKKKTSCLYAYGFFPFYSCAIPAPAPYLRPRHTRAIPAPARSITSHAGDAVEKSAIITIWKGIWGSILHLYIHRPTCVMLHGGPDRIPTRDVSPSKHGAGQGAAVSQTLQYFAWLLCSSQWLLGCSIGCVLLLKHISLHRDKVLYLLPFPFNTWGQSFALLFGLYLVTLS